MDKENICQEQKLLDSVLNPQTSAGEKGAPAPDTATNRRPVPMSENESYTLIIINGSIDEYVGDPCIESLFYQRLTWENAVVMCKLSADQGFQCILKKQQAGCENG